MVVTVWRVISRRETCFIACWSGLTLLLRLSYSKVNANCTLIAQELEFPNMPYSVLHHWKGTKSYLQSTPTNAQIASTHWDFSSYFLTPSIGAMGSPSSHAPVLLQQSAEISSNMKVPSGPTYWPHTVSKDTGSSWHPIARYSNSPRVEVVRPIKLLEVSVLTLFMLQCIFPQSFIFRLLLDIQQTHFLFGKTFGSLV